ncbi:MAG: tRNA (adenosine(37)-N6)-threonylcarbamoyltransferase complex dimerization subunit type 1 TsaB [Saprospiraceae bacterium]
MATILLLETATDVCSVAIAVNGETIALCEDPPPATHAARITLLIQECLQQANLDRSALDAIAISKGPGSYTGLRVGSSTAKGLCFALNIPLIAVDTLAALAYGTAASSPAQPNTVYAPMLDARRNEVWAALFDANLQALTESMSGIIEDNLFYNLLAGNLEGLEKKRLVFSGNGSFKLESGNNFENSEISDLVFCSARFLEAIAEKKFQSSDFEDVSYFEPFYMKPPNITKPKKI